MSGEDEEIQEARKNIDAIASLVIEAREYEAAAQDRRERAEKLSHKLYAGMWLTTDSRHIVEIEDGFSDVYTVEDPAGLFE